MKRVVVLGAGLVVKPAVDYFLEKCGYKVVVTSRKKANAEKIIQERSGGEAFAWSIDQLDSLGRLVAGADLVLSMIPPSMHFPVAEVCVKHRKNMVTTSYLSPAMEGLDKMSRERDILILNEIGEDPGLDNMSAKRLIDQAKSEGGEIAAVTSYGAGLPAFEHNNNPFGYKFSWSPKGVILAAQAPAAYCVAGERVEVPAKELFDHHWLVDLEGIGSFETYPNRDSGAYLDCFQLSGKSSIYRGLLRYVGWCNTMKGMADIGLFDTIQERNFRNMDCAQFMADLIGEGDSHNILQRTARFLHTAENSDVIKKLDWLGLFRNRKIPMEKGSNGDVLVELMTRRMSYAPHERDMVIVHSEIIASFSGRWERRSATLLKKGEPNGDSAMSRAVSLPAAIAARRILEGKIAAKGVHRPTLPEIYHPVLEEMAALGFPFVDKREKIDGSNLVFARQPAPTAGSSL